ncbi:MAG: hypothetical protein U0228_26125 [Myxococcaceae bacterium]
MNGALLVLLASELLSPFHGEFRDAAATVFAPGEVEISVGDTAPPGRDVAWVSGSGDQVELVLHTSRIPGDLRRVLRFSPADKARDRARAAALSLSTMMREREVALQQAAQLPPPTETSTTPPPAWFAHASLVGSLDAMAAAAGAGLTVQGGHRWLDVLEVELGAHLNLSSAPASFLAQPALWVDVGLGPRLAASAWRVTLHVGGGAMLNALSHNGASVALWQPFLRVVSALEFQLGATHGLRVGLGAHLAPQSIVLTTPDSSLGAIGPAWVRLEAGYFIGW